jgi:hypothetical protein
MVLQRDALQSGAVAIARQVDRLADEWRGGVAPSAAQIESVTADIVALTKLLRQAPDVCTS